MYMLMYEYRSRRRKLLPKSVAPLVVAVMLALGVVVLVVELIDIRVLVLWLQEDEGAFRLLRGSGPGFI